MKRIRNAVAIAGTSLVGIGTGLPAKDFADAATKLFEHDGDPIDRITATVASEFKKRGHKSPSPEPIVKTVQAILARNRLTLREAYHLEGAQRDKRASSLSGGAVAKHLISRSAPLLVGLSRTERSDVENLIASVYAIYLRDPFVVEQLLPDALASILASGGLQGPMSPERHEHRTFRRDLLLKDAGNLLPTRAGPDSWYVRAEYGVTPFHQFREADLTALREWAEADNPIGIRLLHGRGGDGKTRLAIEAAKALKQSGWRSGFLAPLSTQTGADALADLFSLDQHIAIVVDYAETRRDEIARLLEAASGSQAKVRVLLIARARADWWDLLRRSSATVQALMTTSADHVRLEPIVHDIELRRAVYSDARDAYARALDVTSTLDECPDLSDKDFDSPLFLQLAGLAAAMGRPLARGDDLIDETLDREQRYWDQQLSRYGLGDDRFHHVLGQAFAILTMVGGASSPTRARELIAVAPLAEGLAKTDVNAIAEIACATYPTPKEYGAIRPDLLGERWVDRQLEKEPLLPVVIDHAQPG